MKNTTKLFLAITATISFAFVKPARVEPKQINVVIDAGHGGSDFGATSDAINEKQIVEQISNKIKSLNENKNVIIHLTRNSDSFLSLNDRVAFINTIKPDLVLSLHVNYSKNRLKSGLEIYVPNQAKSAETSLTIAGKLYDKFSNANIKVSGIKNANFHILKKSEVPAVLIELGYLSNEKDKKSLTDDTEQSRIAKTIIEFISELE